MDRKDLQNSGSSTFINYLFGNPLPNLINSTSFIINIKFTEDVTKRKNIFCHSGGLAIFVSEFLKDNWRGNIPIHSKVTINK